MIKNWHIFRGRGNGNANTLTGARRISQHGVISLLPFIHDSLCCLGPAPSTQPVYLSLAVSCSTLPDKWLTCQMLLYVRLLIIACLQGSWKWPWRPVWITCYISVLHIRIFRVQRCAKCVHTEENTKMQSNQAQRWKLHTRNKRHIRAEVT